jgi:hypothetical protein
MQENGGNEICSRCVRTIGTDERAMLVKEKIFCSECYQEIQREAPTKVPVDNCENCGKPLDKLARRFEWDGHEVCWDCFEELRRPDPGITGTRMLEPEAPRRMTALEMRCGSCGQTVVPVKTKRGDLGLGIVLLLIMMLPGIIYFMFCYGDDFFCPRCKGKLHPPPQIRDLLK